MTFKERVEIGEHVLYWGDCREILPTLEASVCVTDPPYGISFKSGWTGAAIAGDGDLAARDAVLSIWTGPALVFGSPSMPEPLRTKHRLVWHRPGSGMGNLSLPWKPDFEMIYVLGDGFSSPVRGTSVLVFPWDVFRGDAIHPHQKPVALMAELIGKCPDGTIVDPFMGSCSTGVACAKLGRKFIGVEIHEPYFRIACRRIADAVHGGVQPDLFG